MSQFEEGINDSIKYLASDKAFKSLDANFYWPKWNSPWWHMTLLHEMGLAKQIPERAVNKMVEVLKKSPLTIFPIQPKDLPEGMNASLHTHCHCGLGNIYQTLSAWGVDCDSELPWIRKWFLSYQLPDGGFNCDNEAYLKNPPPSSMVGTVPVLEAVLFHTPREFTAEEVALVDKGAQFLIARKLMKATSNPFNAEEKDDEPDWLKPCFPRFYLYDVLRGLTLILKWAERRKKPVPPEAVSDVVTYLERAFPDGQIRNLRRSFDDIGTWACGADGKWNRQKEAGHFMLLDQVSRVREVSPFLTKQWKEAKGL